MEKYENLGMIGEGSYGMVMKCRHKVSMHMQPCSSTYVMWYMYAFKTHNTYCA